MPTNQFTVTYSNLEKTTTSTTIYTITSAIAFSTVSSTYETIETSTKKIYYTPYSQTNNSNHLFDDYNSIINSLPYWNLKNILKSSKDIYLDETSDYRYALLDAVKNSEGSIESVYVHLKLNYPWRDLINSYEASSLTAYVMIN